MIDRLLCLLIGYAAGCILTAEAVSFCKSGKSIRLMGSGNPGMTNTLRIYGRKYGFIVLFGDLFKTAAACIIAGMLFSLPDHLGILYAGLGAILGHNFPFWNGFHGGKGVACTCMAIFCFSPIWGLLSCLLGLAACLLTKYLAIGGTLIPFVYLMFMLYTYSNLEVRFLSLIIFLLMFQRSFVSLKKIFTGQEEKGLWSSQRHSKS